MTAGFVVSLNREHVQVIGAQPGQRTVQLLQDDLAGQAAAARSVVHLPVRLGGQHDVRAQGVPAQWPGPTNSAEVPPWYTLAGSQKVTPSSTAWRKNGAAACSSNVHWCIPDAACP